MTQVQYIGCFPCASAGKRGVTRQTVHAGVTLKVDDRWTFQVYGDNLTDEIGLTEGNPRVIGSQGSGTILARPILGRSFRFTAAYQF